MHLQRWRWDKDKIATWEMVIRWNKYKYWRHGMKITRRISISCPVSNLFDSAAITEPQLERHNIKIQVNLNCGESKSTENFWISRSKGGLPWSSEFLNFLCSQNFACDNCSICCACSGQLPVVGLGCQLESKRSDDVRMRVWVLGLSPCQKHINTPKYPSPTTPQHTSTNLVEDSNSCSLLSFARLSKLRFIHSFYFPVSGKL